MFASRTDWSLTPNRLSQLIEERRRQGLSLIDLTESNPTRCGFAYNSAEILEALADARALTYEPDPRGLLSARLAVASYYAERGIERHPDQIFLTASTSEAYSYVFRLIANAGDSILAPRPSYPLLQFLTCLDDLKLMTYPLVYDRGWQMDLDALKAGVRPSTRAIVVIHPNNPTGSFVHQEELEFLLGLCKEYRLALISDEVFADYAFVPDPTRVMSCSRAEVLSFTLSGLSKLSGLPQMKLAWVVVNGPAGVLNEALARLEVIADTYLSVSGPVTAAAPRLLETRRTLQPQILERVRLNLGWLDGQLTPGSVLTRLHTEGGWCVILKVPGARTDDEWAIELLSRSGILVHPGHFYDFASEGHLVLSLLPPPDIFKTGIDKILAHVNCEQST
jgi:aspartate/methionine/tyrosine aminotransferase